MIELQFDMREFQRTARSMGANFDQIPFALSQALNDAAFKTRNVLINETWPRSVTVRNRNFIRNALRVELSTKQNLSVSITNQGTAAGGRAHLKLHSEGGAKQARGRLAIPGTIVKRERGARGVPERFKPSALANSFRKGDAIYQRVGRHGLRLMYILKPSANMRKDVPFNEAFATTMARELRAAFGPRLQGAMRTRR